MAHPELTKYVANAREQKVSDNAIKDQLIKAGWPEAEVTDAISPKTSSSLLPPPPPLPQFGMWVGFQYVILFISLYVTATALGGILHEAVNQFIPDQLNDLNNYSYGGSYDDFLLKCYIAGLLVGFPIFAPLFLYMKSQLAKKPGIKNLRIRKQLIYITLVLTFVIMIGHVITTIYGLLDGKASPNSFGHLGVTFLVAGSIFGYLLMEVKEDRKT